jgi:hypothetical protein
LAACQFCYSSSALFEQRTPNDKRKRMMQVGFVRLRLVSEPENEPAVIADALCFVLFDIGNSTTAAAPNDPEAVAHN